MRFSILNLNYAKQAYKQVSSRRPSFQNDFNRQTNYNNYERRSSSRNDFNRQKRWSNVSGYEGRNKRFSNTGVAGSLLKEVAWDDVYLKAVHRAVYQEHEAIKSRDQSEIDKWLEENEITLEGNSIPRPIFSFEEAQFPDSIKNYLMKRYAKPTEIQSITWPTVFSGRDLISIAKTGSGKTLGFILPGLIHSITQPKRLNSEGPSILVLVPTRELARQVEEMTNPFSRMMGLRSVCLYGGASKLTQADILQSGVDICVATPGRLLDFLQDMVVDLKSCSYVVFDEADRMLDMGFEPQIRKIVSQIRPDRQSLMFSATWPREIQKLANEFLNDPIYLQCGSSSLSVNRNITQYVDVIEDNNKPQRLIEILEKAKTDGDIKTLIFVETKIRADVLAKRLYNRGFQADAIHGDKSQMQRDNIINQFRKDSSSILVGTDLAARGLDIKDIKNVINYDYPHNSADYIHRIGRTGRSDKKGTSFTFFMPEQASLAPDLIKVLRDAGQEVPQSLEKLVQRRHF